MIRHYSLNSFKLKNINYDNTNTLARFIKLIGDPIVNENGDAIGTIEDINSNLEYISINMSDDYNREYYNTGEGYIVDFDCKMSYVGTIGIIDDIINIRLEKTKNVYIIHHNDLDGWMSGSIVKYFNHKNNIITIQASYEDKKYLDLIDELKSDDTVYIVDFSFDVYDMYRLKQKTKNIIWIDHHDSAIRKFKDTEFENIEGIRYSDKEYPLAACELCWEYFTKGRKSIPKIVKYIGEYDTWRYTKPGYSKEAVNDILDIHYGLFDYFGIENTYKLLESCLDRTNEINIVDLIIAQGKPLRRFETTLNKITCDSKSYEGQFHGHNVLICNTTVKSSLFFGDRINDYDFCIVYNYNGKVYTFSIYTAKPDLKANILAEKYKGGGHAGSAGFSLDYNLFEKKES